MEKRRSGIAIMSRLIVAIKNLLPIMILAILFGIVGFLCAIFITILGGYSLITALISLINIGTVEDTLTKIFVIIVILAVLRGIFHYIEQYCNHFIAFKLLATIRNKVFENLRKLCPAKLEVKEKGNLISLITSDIELLEVFYAHTISPIIIGSITSAIMVVFISSINIFAGIISILAYITVGVIIPLVNGKKGAEKGFLVRNSIGELNSFTLDSLRGIDEILQYNIGDKRIEELNEKSKKLSSVQKYLSILEGRQRALTNMVVIIYSLMVFGLMAYLFYKRSVSFDKVIIATISMMSSFGPVIAISNLSNNLHHTLASGERVISLLDEKPVVEDVSDEEGLDIEIFEGANLSEVDFAYNEQNVLNKFSINIDKNKIVGIHGKSGCGKSTTLKLLMRFWDVNKGVVKISNKNIKEVSTNKLRNIEALVTQQTHIFNDTIANNISISKLDARREEIIEAAKKASIHEFIMSLPKQYDTNVGELGDSLSGGECQRIGIARAFLHDAPFMLLDEPTSNLDTLNEGIILKSLKEYSEDKTILLVSHRKSTMNIADSIINMS